MDVRTRAEWQYVGGPDTTELGRPVLRVEWSRYPDGGLNEGFLSQLDAAGVTPSRPVVFLCRSGVRSVAAAEAAARAGFSHAFNVLDGFEGIPDPEGHRGTVRGGKASGPPWRQS